MNVNGGNQIFRYDEEGNQLDAHNMPRSCMASAVDIEEGWFFSMNNGGGQPIFVWELNDDGTIGEEIGSITNHVQFHNNDQSWNMEWVGDHPEGQLWIIARNNGQAYQIAVDTDDWEPLEAIQNFPVNANGQFQGQDALGHDGQNLWAAGWGPANIRIYDDGIAEARWLTWDPEEGTLEPDASDEIIVLLNSEGVDGGEYEAELYIYSNDPAELDEVPDVTVSIFMVVTGQGRIRVDAGGPEEDNTPIDFGIVYIDYRETYMAEVSNIGTDVLTIEDVEGTETFYVHEDVEFPIDIQVDQIFELPIVFDPLEHADNQEAELLAITNDAGWEEGYPISVIGNGMDAPIIEVDPMEIDDDLIEGESEEYVLTVSNVGGSLLTFETDFELTAEPGEDDERDNRGRNVRRVVENNAQVEEGLIDGIDQPSSDSDVWNHGYEGRYRAGQAGPRRDPLPDDPPGSVFALFQIANPWGYDMERVFTGVEDLEYTRLRDFNDLDLGDFDAVWVTNYQGDQFNRAFNENAAVFEEFVDGGGAYYHCTGTNDGFYQVEHPGGLIPNNQHRTNTGLTVAEQEDCYMFELMEWDPGTRLGGNWFNHESYTIDSIEEIDNLGEYQVLVENDADETPIVVRYEYGRGQCVVSGTTDGFLHNNPGAYLWGAAGGALLYYLDHLANATNFIALDPDEGSVEPDGEVDVIVTISTEGLIDGDYEGIIFFLSSDPETPSTEVAVRIGVEGSSWLTGDPYVPQPLDGAQDIDFPNAYVNGESSVSFTLENLGSLDVEIASWESDNDVFSTDIEDGTVVPARDDIQVTFFFRPEGEDEDAGDYAGTITLNTDAMNVEDGTVWWDVSGLAQIGPIITVDPDGSIDMNLLVGDEDNPVDPVDVQMTISNAAGEFRDDLFWEIDFEEVEEEEEERDNARRNVRSTSGPVAHRDDPGDLLGEFNGINQQNVYCSPAAYDWDNDRMWVSSYNQQISVAYTFDNNYEEFEEVLRINNGGSCMDGAWVNGVFFNNVNGARVVNRWDEEGNRLEAANMQQACFGMGADVNEELLFVLDNAQPYPIHVYEVNGDGEIGEEVGRIGNHTQFHNNQIVWNMEWVGDHPEGQLWIHTTNNGGEANQIFVNTEEWECEERVSVFGTGQGQFQTHDGVAHDGENMWVAGWGQNNIRIYDDGVAEVRWFAIEPDAGTTVPGADSDVVLTFSSEGLEAETLYEGYMTITSNDPQNGAVEIEVSLYTGQRDPEHFEFTPTNLMHTVTVNDFLFDNDPVPSGWEIGVYAPGDVCAGAGVWSGPDRSIEFSAYGDEGDVRGFEEGDDFTFKVWDPEDDQEYSTVAHESVGEGNDEQWTDGGAWSVNLMGYSIRDIVLDLNHGWNLISINVDPPMTDEEIEDDMEGPGVIRLFGELDDNEQLILFKNGAGRFWLPSWGFINIPYYNTAEGYRVKLDTGEEEPNVELTISGAPIPADRPITIGSGWNMVAYYPTYDLDASSGGGFYVVSSIVDNLITAKDVAGRFILTAWNFSNMNPWTAGQGYQIKMDDEAEEYELVYPEMQDEGAAVTVHEDRDHHWTSPVATDNNMSILVNSISGFNAAEGDQIAAFNNSNVLLGSANITDGRCGFAVFGDEEGSDIIEGAMDKEAFSLRIYDADLQVERDVTVTTLAGNGLVYTIDDFSVVDVTVNALIPDEYYMAQNYPNPFNNVTRLAYGMPEASDVKINVYDVTGRLVTELVNGTLNAGHHVALWDANTASAGIYIIRMESSSGFKSVRKVMLVK